MVELLAGALVGDVFSFEASERSVRKGWRSARRRVHDGDRSRTLRPVDGNRDAQLAHAEKLFAKILEQDGTRLPSRPPLPGAGTDPDRGHHHSESLHETLREYIDG